MPNTFKFVCVFYISYYYLKNSRAKLVFHTFSVVGGKISYAVLLNLNLLWLNVLGMMKQLPTEEAQPTPKTSLLYQLKGKAFFHKLLVSMQRKLLLEMKASKKWIQVDFIAFG